MRICYQGVEPKNEVYHEFHMRELKLAARPDTKIFFKFLSKGILTDGDLYAFSYARFLNDKEVMESIIQAEREGYDAVALDCWFDPCLQEAREVLNIPVTGPGESSMLLSCLFGTKFAVISSDIGYIPKFNLMIAAYGMKDRAIEKPVRSMKMTNAKTLFEGIMKPEPIIEDFRNVARICIEDGAEAIIPGCTILASILTLNGLKEIDGVPILDCVIAEIKLAELLVDLKNAGLSWISRKGLYRQPTKQHMKEIKR